MRYLPILFVVFALGGTSSCKNAGTDARFFDGSAPATHRVSLAGVMTANDGYYFLTIDRSEDSLCVGLLPTEPQRSLLRSLDGQRVIVTGDYDPKACGGDFICHDTCGPNAVTRITSVTASSR